MATDVITTQNHTRIPDSFGRYDAELHPAELELLVGCSLDEIDLDSHEYPLELRDRTFCPCCFLHHELVDGCTHHSIDGA